MTRRRRTSIAAPRPALLLLLGLAAALSVLASGAGAMAIVPDSARGRCPSCQVDDPSAPLASTTVVISGHGWGHGLGMSQWGAYGMAKQGIGFKRILSFYYPGTVLGAAPVSSVKVLLGDGVASALVASAQPFTAVDGAGKEWTLPAAGVRIDTTLALPVGPGGTPQFVAGPITFRSDGTPLTLNGKAYRGSLRVGLVPAPPAAPRLAAIVQAPAVTTADAVAPAAPAVVSPGLTVPGTAPATGTSPAAPGGPAAPAPAPTPGLRIINVIGLEAYVAGVVPREVPASWPAAALQAQSVAARSYALAHRAEGTDFDLYSDERSQVYGGVAAEQTATTAAVQATAGRVLLWKGALADTMFSASNGGRTVSAAEAYPGTPDPPPYLAAKDDPYDAAVSPYANWGPVVVSAADVETALGLPGTLVDLTTEATSGPRPSRIAAVTASGTVSVYPSRLRTALNLRSSWVEVAVLSLARGPAAPSYGARVAVSGIVRGLGGAIVEQRTATGWTAVGPAEPDADGRFTIVTRVTGSTELRLSGGQVAGSEVTGALLPLPVAPAVRIAAATDGSGLSGIVRPALSGAEIQIQFDGTGTGTTWTPVGTATVGTDGAFLATLPVASGSYRAVVPGVGGLAAVTTAPVKVTIAS